MSETHTETTPEIPDAVIAEAKEMGWREKEKFKGNPDDWRPADEFVKRGKEILPIVNKTNADQRKRIEALEKMVAGHGDTVKRLEKMHEAGVERAKAQVHAEYKAQVKKAASLGDEDAVDKAEEVRDKELAKIDKAAEKAETKKTEAAVSTDPEVVRWAEENKDWLSDKKLQRHAIAIYDDVAEDMPGASELKRFQEVKKRMVQQFPDKFGEEAEEEEPKRKGSRVEGGSREAGGVSNGSGTHWSKVPQEARPQAHKDVAAKLYPNLEEWAKVFLA